MITKLKKNKKLIPLVIGMEILIGGYALVFIAWALWNRPLGPSMQLVNPVNAQEAISAPVTTPEVNLQGTQISPDPESNNGTILDQLVGMIKPNRTPQVQTVCGAPPVMTLLVIGTDNRTTGVLYGLADSMRLVRIDFVNPGIMSLDLPRDLWVEIPGIADHGVDHGKLNQAFFFGSPGMGYYDGPGEGPGLLARTLELNYGVKGIDHYIAMDMGTFRNMIDSIGGVDVYLDSYVDLNEGQDGANPNIVYPSGSYHLDGEQALALARSRVPTIFQRARNQDIILRGLRDKLLNPDILPQVPGLVDQFSDSVLTDLSAKEVNQLRCLSEKITSENTRIVQFPDSMFWGESTYDPYRNVNTYTLGVDMELLKSYFAAFMQGTWPEE